MKLQQAIKEHGIKLAQIGAELGLTKSAVSMKLNGHRPWTVWEVNQLISWMKSEFDSDLTFLDFSGNGSA